MDFQLSRATGKALEPPDWYENEERIRRMDSDSVVTRNRSIREETCTRNESRGGASTLILSCWILRAYSSPLYWHISSASTAAMRMRMKNIKISQFYTYWQTF